MTTRNLIRTRRYIAVSESRALRELVRAYGYLPRTAPTVWSVS
jgi:hypothetical protein